MARPWLTLWRYVWASPTTALGVIVATLAFLTRGRARVVDGVLEVRGGVVGWLLRRMPFVPGGAAAMTLGHVVVGQDQRMLDRTRTHERVHVEQCERWGPFFLPAYGLASLWALARGRDPYRGNVFEIEAYARDGRNLS